jgi:hypothetical protein
VQIHFMIPVQVYFTDREAARLAAWAKKRKASKSDVVRQAVRAIVQSEEEDPFFAAMGMFAGGPRDLSVHFDHYAVEADRAKRKAQHRKPKPVRRHRRVARVPSR